MSEKKNAARSKVKISNKSKSISNLFGKINVLLF